MLVSLVGILIVALAALFFAALLLEGARRLLGRVFAPRPAKPVGVFVPLHGVGDEVEIRWY